VAPYTTSNGTFFLYAADPQAQAVRAYTIDGNTGALSPISGSPFPAGSAAPMLLTVVQGPEPGTLRVQMPRFRSVRFRCGLRPSLRPSLRP